MTVTTPAPPRTSKKRKLPNDWYAHKENVTPTPKSRMRTPGSAVAFPIPFTPSTPADSCSRTPSDASNTSVHRPPLSEKKNRPRYQNGYLVQPPTPSPAKFLLKRGQRTSRAFPFEVQHRLLPLDPWSTTQWNEAAQTAGLISPGQTLRPFQLDVANLVIQRRTDVCLIAPTGSGKSLVWVLPLLAQKVGISLVIVPYTSLGHQGELRRYGGSQITTTFINSKNKGPERLESLAKGGGMQIVYICAEMLESPSMGRVLHSESFKAQLSAIYIDEAHVPHESQSYRTAYSNLRWLRRIAGLADVPMVAISATLPTIYRNSLTALSGLKPNYRLINLGNFRPELSVIIKKMEYDMSTFKDLEFLFTWSIDPRHPATIPSCIIYTDDIDRLTAMFWWFRGKLREQGLPIHWVDLIHAGLSRHHQEASTRRFRDGQTRIWLGTEKIGPGVDVAHVTLVIQYGCRGLTLVGWEQRRGRGARSTGTYAIGVLLVEKSMADGQLTVASPGYEDPGLLQLVRSPPTTCYEQIVLYLLEDPRHNPDLRCGTRCSNCKPELIALVRSYTWISVDPGTSRAMASASTALAAPTAAQIAATLARLKEWRFRHWEESWKEQWFSYGPDDLIDDRDLQSLVKSIHNITTLDDIYQRTQIPHFEEIAPRLLLEIENIRRNMYGELAVTAHASTPALEQPQGPQPSPNLQEPRYAQIRWVDTVDTQVEPTPAHPRIISPSIQAAPSKPTRNQFRMHQLYPGEQVLSFNTP